MQRPPSEFPEPQRPLRAIVSPFDLRTGGDRERTARHRKTYANGVAMKVAIHDSSACGKIKNDLRLRAAVALRK